jgi:hypothetical protein
MSGKKSVHWRNLAIIGWLVAVSVVFALTVSVANHRLTDDGGGAEGGWDRTAGLSDEEIRIRQLESAMIELKQQLKQKKKLDPNLTETTPVKTEVHEAPQLLLNDTPVSDDPADRNILIVCYGQTGDSFFIEQEAAGGAPTLWVMRSGEKFQAIAGTWKDNDGIGVPADAYVLLNEFGRCIGWMPSWILIEVSQSAKPQST